MTPHRNPETFAQRKYNRSHKTTQCCEVRRCLAQSEISHSLHRNPPQVLQDLPCNTCVCSAAQHLQDQEYCPATEGWERGCNWYGYILDGTNNILLLSSINTLLKVFSFNFKKNVFYSTAIEAASAVDGPEYR
ncbi:hypothetical protein E2C01_034284 [Portunus trituberculatus]|uniref:Uncharacterized protein n=1 Tax=Portunus trituberculatus TaxID=210409 RepID=A0A5B7F676_PORTR|nr:hypothetical protein [Portunus trituberculatus]